MTISDMAAALTPSPDPAWVVELDGFDPSREASRRSRFAVSNGRLGVPGGRAVDRGTLDGAAPCTWIAGLFDVADTSQPIPALVAAPDWLCVGVAIGGATSAVHAGTMSCDRRTLDMRRGLLVTEGLLVNVPGVRVRLRVLRVVSHDNRSVGMQLIRLSVEAGEPDITIAVSFGGLDCGLIRESLDQDAGVWRTHATGRRLAMAAGATLRIDGGTVAPAERGSLSSRWAVRVRPGQDVCLDRIVAIESGRPPFIGNLARATLGRASALGWRGVLTRHEAAWTKRMDFGDVVVEGDAAAQRALRFATYHLTGAADPDDDRISIAARGLTGAGYHGHVFWDTEIFLLPFYTLTWPAAARAMLMYRFHTLDAARAKAARLGWQGALYAWESADTGAEATPEHAIGPDRKVVAILCGTQEQHIAADVAYAVWHYWDTTRDDAFLREAGAEILLETARFWASRAVMEADGHGHVRGVIGPDEYHEDIDDNAFTNVMAQWNIRRAIDVAALLRDCWPERWADLAGRIGVDDAELARWAAAADTIATGFDPATGLYEQFGGFSALEPIDIADYAGRSVPMDVVLGRDRIAGSQVIKQADVVALLMLLPGAFADDGGATNFDHYAKLCCHGSSLSRAMHGVAAARLGRTEVALAHMMAASAIDLADTHAALDGGVHVAALGGVWMIAVLGFGGVSTHADHVALAPNLPAGWRSLAFALRWRGRMLRVRIAAGALLVTLEAGEDMTLAVAGVRHRLSRAGPLEAAL